MRVPEVGVAFRRLTPATLGLTERVPGAWTTNRGERTHRTRDWGSCHRGPSQFYAGGMNTVHLTDEELEIACRGMTAFLHSFGHDEADTVALIRAVLARLAAARQEPSSPAAAG